MEKSLDRKLAAVRGGGGSRSDFIIADAKDADMAFGVRAMGSRGYLSAKGAHPADFSPEIWTREEFGFRNLPEFLDIIRDVVHQGLVDIMLMSASVNDQLTIQEKLFEHSPMTPAARANDATDVWAVRHGDYLTHPAQPFRSASIDQIQCGRVECDRSRPGFPGANLGLYSVTYVNEIEQDLRTLNAFKAFREEAESKGFRYFLEVFDPNVNSGISPDKLGEFINDHILRTLAGVPDAGRPVFLKIVYHGPRSLEELVQYDPNMVVGVLGGSAGTTYDAFRLIHDAQKHGARVALFGRKINNAEHQLAFIEMLRRITDGQIGPEEAVKAYHGVLQGLGIHPHRELSEDLQLSAQSMSYDGSEKKKSQVRVTEAAPRKAAEARTPKTAPAVSKPAVPVSRPAKAPVTWPVRDNGKPDFAAMSAEQRTAYHKARLKKMFG